MKECIVVCRIFFPDSASNAQLFYDIESWLRSKFGQASHIQKFFDENHNHSQPHAGDSGHTLNCKNKESEPK